MCWPDHTILVCIRIEARDREQEIERERVSFGFVEGFDFKVRGILQKVVNMVNWLSEEWM